MCISGINVVDDLYYGVHIVKGYLSSNDDGYFANEAHVKFGPWIPLLTDLLFLKSNNVPLQSIH